MQRSFDERMGVMNNLVERDTDAVNRAAAAINALQSTLQKQQGDSASHVDQLSGQIQTLNDSLDELKARLAKVSKQLEDMQSIAAKHGCANGSASKRSSKLWRRRLRPTFSITTLCATTTAPRTNLPFRSFPITSSSIPTPISPEIVTSISAKFNSVRETISRPRRATIRFCRTFPPGRKVASAQLKKGFSLIELGKQEDGVAELRHVIQRYPRSPEALQARERLRKLGVYLGRTLRR